MTKVIGVGFDAIAEGRIRSTISTYVANSGVEFDFIHGTTSEGPLLKIISDHSDLGNCLNLGRLLEWVRHCVSDVEPCEMSLETRFRPIPAMPNQAMPRPVWA